MLLIHTLECLYSLSSLGEQACNAIVHVSGAIDSLVSLITVEVCINILLNVDVIGYENCCITKMSYYFVPGSELRSKSLHPDAGR